ncbi:unnamed protein product [Echinostoma caproni]|uniref:Homeobox protein DLX-2 n=1 Tax=Echinostoma caproni TaxID=27848 RepID=A0A183AF76_9TREM|nr:unnamed protein product [Echinostoma caproni]
MSLTNGHRSSRGPQPGNLTLDPSSAAAAAAAFSLKASSLAHSDMNSSYCYDTSHYSPGPYQSMNNGLDRTVLSPHSPIECEFRNYGKKELYTAPVQTNASYRTGLKSTKELDKTEC